MLGCEGLRGVRVLECEGVIMKMCEGGRVGGRGGRRVCRLE